MAQPTRNERLAAVHHPFEGARHFRHQAGKPLRDIGRRRARGVGGAPDHDAAGLVEFRDRQPRRSFRRGVEQQMRAPFVHRDETRKLRIAGHRAQPLIGSPFEIVAEETRDRVSPASRSALRRCRSMAGTARLRSPQGRARPAPPPRPSATAADAANRRDRRSPRSRQAPTSAAQRPRRPRRDRD